MFHWTLKISSCYRSLSQRNRVIRSPEQYEVGCLGGLTQVDRLRERAKHVFCQGGTRIVSVAYYGDDSGGI